MGAAPARAIIRRMRVDDIQQVHAIDVLSFALPWTERSYRFDLTENPNAYLWVAELEARVVGMIVVWVILDEAHIGSIATHPDHRHEGIGRQLLLTALQEMSRRGIWKATLEVRRSNLTAQALYREFGFQVVGFRPRYYRDNNEDALLMTLPVIDDAKLQRLAGGGGAG